MPDRMLNDKFSFGKSSNGKTYGQRPDHKCPTHKTEKHMSRISRITFSLLFMFIPAMIHAQSLSLERVAAGLASPIFVTHAPGDADRLFIVQRSGAIRILDLNNTSQAPTTFMTVPLVDTTFEGGLLGLAFHPDYQQNGLFYVN